MEATANQKAAEPLLLRDDHEGVCILTLNRPRHYNALSSQLLLELQTEFDTIATNDSIRVVIITANGKAFCAGHDLKEMRSSEDPIKPCLISAAK